MPGSPLHGGLEKCRESPFAPFSKDGGGRELNSVGSVCPTSSVFVKVPEIWHLVTDSKTPLGCVGRVVVSEEGAWMGPRGFTAAALGQTADERDRLPMSGV